MKIKNKLSVAAKLTIACLIIAATGLIIQILSGANYPVVPPGLFILLVPAALISMGKWRWPAIVAVVAGIFLTFGLFTSGAYKRLFIPNSFGDTVGLWIQAVAVALATIFALITAIGDHKTRV